MESFEPELREALKQAHPGLTDADVAQVEAALSDRQHLDRRRRPEEAERAERRWAEVTRKVPRLQEVMLEFDRRQLRERRPIPRPAVEVRPKP